jgi:hypothetical protein
MGNLNVTFPPRAAAEPRSGPSLPAITLALTCIACAIFWKHFSAWKKGLGAKLETAKAIPQPEPAPPPPPQEKERRMEYVFTDADIASVQHNVASGVVAISKLLIHPIKVRL